MKTFEFRPHVHGRPKSKIILIMKICTFILLVFNLGLSASGYSQQKKVTLDFKNATSKEFFAEIQKQTGYCFIFNTNQGEQIGEITISVRNKSVQEVMEEILRPTGFSYTFQNDIIVITPKMAEPEKNILTGLVFDENKQPLPGVTVLVKGSSNENSRLNYKKRTPSFSLLSGWNPSRYPIPDKKRSRSRSNQVKKSWKKWLLQVTK